MKLSDLSLRTLALVKSVVPVSDNDPIARRLGELGFVNGESVQVLTLGPIGAEPLLVQIGFTKFALRRSEAARVLVTLATGDLHGV